MVRLRPPVNIRACAPLAALLLLVGCASLPDLPERPREVFTTPVVYRGHAVTEAELGQLVPGVSTRADVQALLGSPSHTSTFGGNEWYYIAAVSRTRPARSLSVTERRVVVAVFDDAGVLRQTRRIEEAEMPTVAFVRRETPTPGGDMTILQALFGNIGRFGPGGPTPQATPGP